jgi:hypothetical protein
MSSTSTAWPGPVSFRTCLAGIARDDHDSLCHPNFFLVLEILVDSGLPMKPTSLIYRKPHEDAI